MSVSGPLLEKMEMSLVKSLHSGDFDVICLVWLARALCQYSGLNNLQVLFSLHRSVFMNVLVTTCTGRSLVASSYVDVSNSSLLECTPPNVEAWVQWTRHVSLRIWVLFLTTVLIFSVIKTLARNPSLPNYICSRQDGTDESFSLASHSSSESWPSCL
jgi:hypothetical protein